MTSYQPLSQTPATPQTQSEVCSDEPPRYADTFDSSQIQTERRDQPYPPVANVIAPPVLVQPPPPLPPQTGLYHYQPCPPNTISPVVLNRHFGKKPISIRCPICQKDVVTEIVYELGAMVWIAAGIILLLGIFLIFPLFLFWIPFFVDDFKDIIHICPNCCYIFGRKKRI